MWLTFEYAPASLFSLKPARATSTAGTTLLIPTPYAVKMAFLDAALRHGLAASADEVVGWLARATLRIGPPRHACVTGTIQTVRQETRDAEHKRKADAPPYRATIALREVVHYEGSLRVAFDLTTCAEELVALLFRAAPAINYFGKRGSFVQYRGGTPLADLDSRFTRPADDAGADGQRAALDDFGAKASFAALNSFGPGVVKRNIDRRFVETSIPLRVLNSGPGFVHYSAPPTE